MSPPIGDVSMASGLDSSCCILEITAHLHAHTEYLYRHSDACQLASLPCARSRNMMHLHAGLTLNITRTGA